MIKLLTELLGFIPSYLTQRSFVQKLTDIVYVSLIVMMLTLVYNFVTKFDSILLLLDDSHNDLIENTVNASLYISPILDQINIALDSDSSAVFRYHNGLRGINGFSFLRKSATNFRRSDQSEIPSYLMELITNMPASSDLLQLRTHSSGDCLLRQVSESSEAFTILRIAGVESYASCPIFDNRNALVGYVSVHWYSTMKDERVLGTIKEYTAQIARHESFLTEF